MECLDLFRKAPEVCRDISGLRYLPNFIGEIDEQALISRIDSIGNWCNSLRRRVQHYGFRYDYRSRSIDPSTMKAPGFPPWLIELRDRILREGLIDRNSDQAIINEYLPGQGIAGHVDCEPCFGPVVVSLSLGSGCEMVFERVIDKAVRSIYLEPRSILVLQGGARYNWKHGIPSRISDTREGVRLPRQRRISITFRTVIIKDSELDSKE